MSHLFLCFDSVFLSTHIQLNGAELSSDATNAQIMLVDPSSRQGRLFIDDWGQDSNRTVLNSTWVKKSIAAGRPLLDGDEWGDCWPHEEAFPPTNGEGDDDILDSGPAKCVFPDIYYSQHILTLYHLCKKSFTYTACYARRTC